MKIHEYQAKAILAQFQVPVRAASSPSPPRSGGGRQERGGRVVVKAQIQRAPGKGGA